jgi:hypothetical protein
VTSPAQNPSESRQNTLKPESCDLRAQWSRAREAHFFCFWGFIYSIFNILAQEQDELSNGFSRAGSNPAQRGKSSVTAPFHVLQQSM